MLRLPVRPSEIDQHKHNRYLNVLAGETEPLSEAMLAMAAAAAAVRQEGNAAAALAGVIAMAKVSGRAAIFLSRLAETRCPVYFRGADGQIQAALRLLVDGGKRGADAGRSGKGNAFAAAAAEMEVANNDMIEGASRIDDWRSGTARS